MTKKKLFLHIGPPKTGTSAIQNFLHTNSKLLKNKHNVCYPCFHKVDKGVFNNSRGGNGHAVIKSPDLLNEVLKQSVGVQATILSSEFFIEADKELLETLAEAFDVEVIFYVRRSDNLLLSQMSEMIKNSLYVESFEALRPFPQLEIIRRFQRIFGKIIVRVYESSQFVGGNIFSDFLDAVGIKITSDFVLAERKINPSFQGDYLKLSNLINSFNVSKKYKRKFSDLLWQLSIETPERGFHQSKLIGSSNRIEIIKKSSAEEAEIAREFLGRTDGKIFYDPLPEDVLHIEKGNELSTDSVAESLSYLVVKQQEELDSLSHRLTRVEVQRQSLQPTSLPVTSEQSIDSSKKYQSAMAELKQALGIEEGRDPAEIYRDISIFLEKLERLESAQMLMRIALELRPSGPYIIQKISELNKKLEDEKIVSQRGCGERMSPYSFFVNFFYEFYEKIVRVIRGN